MSNLSELDLVRYTVEFVASLSISLLMQIVLAAIVSSLPFSQSPSMLLGDLYGLYIPSSWLISLLLVVTAKVEFVKRLYESYLYYSDAMVELDLGDLIIATLIWLISLALYTLT